MGGAFSFLKPFLSPGCGCGRQGTIPARCLSGAEACFCNQVSGQCPCCPHTLGRDYSRCAPLFWNLGVGPEAASPAAAVPNTLCSQCITQ